MLLLPLNLNFAVFSKMESSPMCLGKTNYFHEGCLGYNSCKKKIKIFLKFRVTIFKTQNIASALKFTEHKCLQKCALELFLT